MKLLRYRWPVIRVKFLSARGGRLGRSLPQEKRRAGRICRKDGTRRDRRPLFGHCNLRSLSPWTLLVRRHRGTGLIELILRFIILYLALVSSRDPVSGVWWPFDACANFYPMRVINEIRKIILDIQIPVSQKNYSSRLYLTSTAQIFHARFVQIIPKRATNAREKRKGGDRRGSFATDESPKEKQKPRWRRRRRNEWIRVAGSERREYNHVTTAPSNKT